MTSLTFHGGVGEIGGNKILLEDGDTRIWLDFGLSFTSKGSFYDEFFQPRTNSGLRDIIELGILPKIDGIYRADLLKLDGIENVIADIGCSKTDLWISNVKSYDKVADEQGKPFIDGVLVSHGHFDHFQCISFLDEKIPIYCSSITKALIEATNEIGKDSYEKEFLSVKKRGIATVSPSGNAFFPGEYTITTESQNRDFQIIDEGVQIGGLEVKSISVDHSVPGATAFVIETSKGETIVYTGDLRFHGTRHDLTEAFRATVNRMQPDVLIVEGTRIDKDEPDSESEVKDECIRLISQAKGLAMVGFAWKDITRYQTMKEVAHATGRILVISPKLAYVINKLHSFSDLSLKPIEQEQNVRVYLKRKDKMLYSKADYSRSKYEAGYSVEWDRSNRETIDLTHFKNGARAYQIKKKPSKYIIHLDFYDFNELLDLSPPEGSIYISANSEPFNLEMELDEKRIKNWLKHFYINSPTYDLPHIHASGHASGPEIKRLVQEINPKVVYPVHTEHPELFKRIKGVKVDVPELGKAYQI